jgi:hypothetical protein
LSLIEHAVHIGDLMKAIVATTSAFRELLGGPSAELAAGLADSPVSLFATFQSMWPSLTGARVTFTS